MYFSPRVTLYNISYKTHKRHSQLTDILYSVCLKTHILFHHDNIPAQRANTCTDYLTAPGLKLLEHPPPPCTPIIVTFDLTLPSYKNVDEREAVFQC